MINNLQTLQNDIINFSDEYETILDPADTPTTTMDKEISDHERYCSIFFNIKLT